MLNLMNNENIVGLVEQQRRLGRAKNTLSAMINSYKRLAKYMDFDLLEDISKKQAQEIVIKMSEDGYSKSTIKLSLVYLRELYDYAEIESPFRGLKYSTQKKNSKKDTFDFFTLDQAKRLLEVSKGKGRLMDKRNHAMISLMLNAGLRKSEIMSLDRDNINFEECEIYLHDTKTEDYVVISVSDSVIEALRVYNESREDDLSPMFISSYKQRISDSGMDAIIAKLYKKANIKGSCHTLRHTTCSLMADQGFDPIDIQKRARHSSLSTTMIYISQSKDRKREVANKMVI